MEQTDSRRMATAPLTVPATIAATIQRLLDYITSKHAVSFDDIHRYMDQEQLRFGANTNTIDILDLAAYRTGSIDVDYHSRMIYSRPGQQAPQSPQPAVSATASPIASPTK
jgi:hypothetical protein